jgi:hypothetical protein
MATPRLCSRVVLSEPRKKPRGDCWRFLLIRSLISFSIKEAPVCLQLLATLSSATLRRSISALTQWTRSIHAILGLDKISITLQFILRPLTSTSILCAAQGKGKRTMNTLTACGGIIAMVLCRAIEHGARSPSATSVSNSRILPISSRAVFHAKYNEHWMRLLE